jgi:hypothetical protein
VTRGQKTQILLLAGAVAVSRFAFRSHFLYDLDSVNFALGMRRFDPRVHQPHPPGYYLYVLMGRAVNYFVHDANLALVLVSIAASMVCAGLIYNLAREWFGTRAAQFAGVLFLLSPLAWFHGIVALTYSVEAAASALIGTLCWRIERGRAGYIVPTAMVLGITAGVRPSSILFLGPLFLFSVRRAPVSRMLLGAVALAATGAAWFFPMIAASGGFAAYFGALTSLWRLVPSKGTVFNSSPVTSIARALTIVYIYFLCFGAAVVAPLGARCMAGAGESDSARTKKLFTAVWMVPGLCFFTLIFLKLVNSGYLLLVVAPACVWLGAWTAAWYEHGSWPKGIKMATVAVGAAVNVAIFLFFPVYGSYRSVRQFEGELRAVNAALAQVGGADKLLIVSFDNHFLGYRHAGYYLPDYLTIEYPAAKLVEGPRVFAMRGRDSMLLSALPGDGYARFVFYPLPNGDAAYTQYVQTVLKLLPPSDLATAELGGHRFVTAPMKDLPLLFPDVALRPAAAVGEKLYTSRSTALGQP